jgi:hypothetical protein
LVSKGLGSSSPTNASHVCSGTGKEQEKEVTLVDVVRQLAAIKEIV